MAAWRNLPVRPGRRLNHGDAASLIGLLASHEQPVAYLTGLAVHRASSTYRGEGKTDAKDAFVIAGQAHLRRDLGLLRPGDEIAVDLRTLTTRRLDLVFDRTRQINRLRARHGSTRATRRRRSSTAPRSASTSASFHETSRSKTSP